jgi:hypothetical protein
MPHLPARLSHFHNSAIAVAMAVNGAKRVLRGKARYQRSHGGGALHVTVADAGGEFVLVLDEEVWDGDAVVDCQYGCDYRIDLCG